MVLDPAMFSALLEWRGHGNHSEMPKYFHPLMKGLLLVVSALFLIPVDLFAWTNGELLIWMDADRGHALETVAKKFEDDFGLKVTIEAPRDDYRQFPNCCANGKGTRHCHLGAR